jgi:hypothetical protein
MTAKNETDALREALASRPHPLHVQYTSYCDIFGVSLVA